MALSKIDTTNMIEDVPQSKLDNNINFRNIIINGGMDLAQRGTSFTGLQNSPVYGIDRWAYRRAGTFTSATFSMTQSTDVPTGQGFAKSLKIDCTAAEASLPAGVYAQFAQYIEGQMLQYLKKGTSSAESVTMSFWVKSNKTGTYIAELRDRDNSRNICKSYTINSANTWEKKTITFAGDTTGAFGNDNASSLQVNWNLCAGTDFTSGTLQTSWGSEVSANRAVGQVNFADSTSNEWYITGVQLEAGTTASDFEFLPTDVNLQRCLRYYNHVIDGQTTFFKMISASGTFRRIAIPLSTTMRATPTVTITGTTNGTYGTSNPTTDSGVSENILNLKGDVVSNTGTYSYIQQLKADAEL